MYVGMIMMMCWQLFQNQPRLNRHIHISKLMMKFGNQFKIILKADRFPDNMIATRDSEGNEQDSRR
jgi:hypothetical protein